MLELENVLHPAPHPLAGAMARLRPGVDLGHRPVAEALVEDWADRVYGGRSWTELPDNSASVHYAVRLISAELPVDDDVLCATADGRPYLLHVTELAEREGGPVAASLNSRAAGRPWRWSVLTAGPVLAVVFALAVLPAQPRPVLVAPGPLTAEVRAGGDR